MSTQYISFVLLSLFLRSTLLLLVVGIAAFAVRHKSASVRHGILRVGLLCLFVLPVLPFAGPHWTVPYQNASAPVVTSALQYSPVSTVRFEAVSTEAASSASSSYARPEIVRPSGEEASMAMAPQVAETQAVKVDEDGRSLSWQFWALATWMVGFFVLLTRLLLSHVAAWRLTKHDAGLVLSLSSGALSSVASGRIVVNDRVAMPMTWGVAPAVVLLPAASISWPDERLRAVLLHERAHIERRDWLVQVASEVVRAAYWPHPLVWLLVRQLRLEAEMAADDAVLACGLTPSAYAGELVECVRQARQSSMGLATVAMADRHAMSARVRAVLDQDASRSRLHRRAAIAVALVGLAITIIVGATWTGRASTPISAPGDWEQTLPGGIKVELVGITSDPVGWNEQGWWGPDGKPIADPSEEGPAFHRPDAGLGDQYVRRTIYVLITSKDPISDVSAIGETTKPELSEFGIFQLGKSHIMSGLQLASNTPTWGKIPLAFRSSASEFGYRFGVAAGPWKTVANVPNNLASEANSSAPGLPVYDPYVTLDNHPRIEVYGHIKPHTYRTPIVSLSLLPLGENELGDVDRRLLALDAQGNTVSIVALNDYESEYETAVIPPAALKRIARFEFQTREFSWVEFDHIQNVPMEQKGVISPAHDIAIPPALPQFSRTLPDGSHLDLVAVMRSRAEGERWWRPDGSTLAGRVKDWADLAIDPERAHQVREREVFVRYTSTHATDVEYSMQMSIDNDSRPRIDDIRQINMAGIDLSEFPGKLYDQTINGRVSVGADGREVHVKMGVTTGTWKRVASLPMTLSPLMVSRQWCDVLIRLGGSHVSMVWLDASGKPRQQLFPLGATEVPDGYAERIVAIMNDGMSRTLDFNANYVDRSGAHAKVYEEAGLCFNEGNGDRGPDPALNKVRRFDLYVQPYTWVTFPAIPADPNA